MRQRASRPKWSFLFSLALLAAGGGARAVGVPPDAATAVADVGDSIVSLKNLSRPLESDYASKDRRAVLPALKGLSARLDALQTLLARGGSDKLTGVQALGRSAAEASRAEESYSPQGDGPQPAKTAAELRGRLRALAEAYAALYPEAVKTAAARAAAPLPASARARAAERALASGSGASADPSRFFDQNGTRAALLDPANSGRAGNLRGQSPADPAAPRKVRYTAAASVPTLHTGAVPLPGAPVPAPPLPAARIPGPVRASASLALNAAAAQTPVAGRVVKAALAAPAPAPAPAAPAAPAAPMPESACAQALKGHDAIVDMCKTSPTLAPLLAGLVESLQEQFGSAEGVVQTLAFMLMGLLMSVLSGFGVVARVVVSIASFAMLAGTLYSLLKQGYAAGKELVGTAASDPKHAEALKSMGKIGGTVLILALMSLLGWGVGKTKMGKGAMEGMTGALGATMEKLGIAKGAAGLDALLPAPVKSVLAKLFPASAAAGADAGKDGTKGAPKAEAPKPAAPPPPGSVAQSELSYFAKGGQGTVYRVEGSGDLVKVYNRTDRAVNADALRVQKQIHDQLRAEGLAVQTVPVDVVHVGPHETGLRMPRVEGPSLEDALTRMRAENPHDPRIAQYQNEARAYLSRVDAITESRFGVKLADRPTNSWKPAGSEDFSNFILTHGADGKPAIVNIDPFNMGQYTNSLARGQIRPAAAPAPSGIFRSEKARQQFSDDVVHGNAALATRDARVAAARAQLGADEASARAIADAHDRVPCPVGGCTPAQIREKLRIMKDVPVEQRDAAIRAGLAGEPAAAAPRDYSPEQWAKEVVAKAHDDGTRAVVASMNGSNHPLLKLTMKDGTVVSGTFAGISDGEMMFKSGGGLVPVRMNSGEIARVDRVADVFDRGDLRQHTIELYGSRPPVRDPFVDLKAYVGRVVDIESRDLEGGVASKWPNPDMKGRVVKVEGGEIVIQTDKGLGHFSAEDHRIDRVSLLDDAYDSKGQVPSISAVNAHIPNGTVVDATVPGRPGAAGASVVRGIFRGVQNDAQGHSLVLIENNAQVTGYRDVLSVRTEPGAPTVLFAQPAPK